MTQKQQITGVLLGLCITLAGADYFFKERYKPSTADESLFVQQEQNTSGATSSASSKKIVKKGQKIQKKSEQSLEAIAQTFGGTLAQNSERSLLHTMLSGSSVTSAVILKEEQRLAFIAYIESTSMQEVFMKMKEALAQQFSSEVRIITDEVQEPTDQLLGAEMLQFFDPSMNTETITLLRIRSRLYEIHAEQGKNEEVRRLIDVLRRR